jgi:hypothetical protein
MVQALKAPGHDVKFTVYPGCDHFILDTYEHRELDAWFPQHSRKRESGAQAVTSLKRASALGAGQRARHGVQN